METKEIIKRLGTAYTSGFLNTREQKLRFLYQLISEANGTITENDFVLIFRALDRLRTTHKPEKIDLIHELSRFVNENTYSYSVKAERKSVY